MKTINELLVTQLGANLVLLLERSLIYLNYLYLYDEFFGTYLLVG